MGDPGVSRSKLRRESGRPASLALAVALLTVCSGCTAATGSGEGTATALNTRDIQSVPSHSNSADPDYAVVFPDDRVNVMSIAITPENWQKMLDNMTELYGEFSGSTTAGSGAGRGAQPGGGLGMGIISEINPVYVPADVSCPELVVCEIKHERSVKNTPAQSTIRSMGIQERAFSKYCIGVSLLYDRLKHNRFKPNLRFISRLSAGGSLPC